MENLFLLCLCFLVVTSADNFQRTIVVIHKKTSPSEYLFLRGGDERGEGIPIRQRIKPEQESSKFSVLSQGDTTLDWKDREKRQPGQAFGTPMMWTTNDRSYKLDITHDGAGYFDINVATDHMWVVDVDMDCDKTRNGWFQYKGFITQNGRPKYEKNTYNGWEQVRGGNFCEGELLPNGENFQHGFSWVDKQNHLGKCGAFNYVSWGNGTSCFIHSVEFVEMLAHGIDPSPEGEFYDDTETIEEPMEE